MIIDATGWPTLKLSRLYKIEPIGIGTPLVESLSGYVTRLALAHLVSTTNLTKYIVSPLLSHVCLQPDNMLIGSYHSVTTMNGNNRSARAWVDALEQLTTRDDLSKLTLIPFAHMFSDNGLLSQVKRWCPHCLEEWRDKEETFYEPLLWSISLVEVCTFHNVPLVKKCPYCNNLCAPLAPRSNPGFCHICEEWLGSSSNTQLSECNEGQIRVAKEIGELLEKGSIGKIAQNETIPAVLDYLLRKRIKIEGERSLARQIGVSPKKMYQWLEGNALPSLDKLLRLCWLFELRLSELDMQVCLENPSGFDERFADSLENSLASSYLNWMKIEKLMHEIIEGKVAPMRVREIAHAYGCASERLYYRYSDLCKSITAIHARYRLDQRLNKI